MRHMSFWCWQCMYVKKGHEKSWTQAYNKGREDLSFWTKVQMILGSESKEPPSIASAENEGSLKWLCCLCHNVRIWAQTSELAYPAEHSLKKILQELTGNTRIFNAAWNSRLLTKRSFCNPLTNFEVLMGRKLYITQHWLCEQGRCLHCWSPRGSWPEWLLVTRDISANYLEHSKVIQHCLFSPL